MDSEVLRVVVDRNYAELHQQVERLTVEVQQCMPREVYAAEKASWLDRITRLEGRGDSARRAWIAAATAIIAAVVSEVLQAITYRGGHP